MHFRSHLTRICKFLKTIVVVSAEQILFIEQFLFSNCIFQTFWKSLSHSSFMAITKVWLTGWKCRGPFSAWALFKHGRSSNEHERPSTSFEYTGALLVNYTVLKGPFKIIANWGHFLKYGWCSIQYVSLMVLYSQNSGLTFWKVLPDRFKN